VSPGAVSTTLDTLLLQGTANNITVSTVFPTIEVSTLALEANAISTVIVPAAATLSLDTLLLDADILDIIAQIVIQTVAGGVAVSDSLISDILLSDEAISVECKSTRYLHCYRNTYRSRHSRFTSTRSKWEYKFFFPRWWHSYEAIRWKLLSRYFS
jgi:hypothetical protein